MLTGLLVARQIGEMHERNAKLKTLKCFFSLQREKAHGQNGGTRASWEGVPWRGPPVETSLAV